MKATPFPALYGKHDDAIIAMHRIRRRYAMNGLKPDRTESQKAVLPAIPASWNKEDALKYAKEIGAKITGVVGRDGGYTAQVADACVIIPTVNSENITPHSEAFQAVIWHLLVSHPKLKENQTKWESAVKK